MWDTGQSPLDYTQAQHIQTLHLSDVNISATNVEFALTKILTLVSNIWQLLY